VTLDGGQVRDALVRQWRGVAEAIPDLDLETPSRIAGWRNREVLAHLYAQPVLLERFVAAATNETPHVDAAANLAGTVSFRAMVDSLARQGADMGKVDLGVTLARVLPRLESMDTDMTVTSVQGPISLVDYLVTRCVEAVVHGDDLVPPVDPDPVARSITAHALLHVLEASSPQLVPLAERLGEAEWIDVATGRATASGDLAPALPLMF
jgi:hypothetical protein